MIMRKVDANIITLNFFLSICKSACLCVSVKERYVCITRRTQCHSVKRSIIFCDLVGSESGTRAADSLSLT